MQALSIPVKGLSASELLVAWERGLGQPPAEQAMALLAAAYPAVPPHCLARLTIGQRDACLLALRRLTFDRPVAAVETCPACGERLELSFGVDDIWAGSPSVFNVSEEGASGETRTVSFAGYDVTFRLPNTLDLEACETNELEELRLRVLGRCVLTADYEGKGMAARDLPDDVIATVAEEMERADPQANIQLALSCPACGHEWRGVFDIASFFWTEINTWAYRVLREVHTLALAYGWHERDILAMSASRRAAYLSMVNG